MQAIEFETDIENGALVIPKELQMLKGHFRIIALFQENAVEQRDSIPQTRFEDVAGCLRYSGPAKSQDDMENAIRTGVAAKWT